MTDPTTTHTEGEIRTSRAFAVPRATLWAAFTDPTILARWWGPDGAVNEFQRYEPVTGGGWDFVMRMPDGAAYPMTHVFREVVPLERIVADHLQAGHDFQFVFEFMELSPARSRLEWRMRFADPAEGERVRAVVTDLNEQNLDRLAATLAAREASAS